MVDDDMSGSEEGMPFNMALATLKRISDLREEQIGARKNADVNTWQHSLNSLYVELRGACPLTPDEKGIYTTYRTKFTALNKEHTKVKCYKTVNRSGKTLNIQTCAHSTEFHNVCHDYEIELIDIGQKYDIFTPGSSNTFKDFKGE